MIDSITYAEDLRIINERGADWQKLDGKTLLITGATGLIGSVLADAIILRNELYHANINIWLLGRNEYELRKRYGNYLDRHYFHYILQDVAEKIDIDGPLDYIIHAASKGDPDSFVTDPVGVMNSNYMGMYRLLELARAKWTRKVLFISSGEVYGIAEHSENLRDIGLKEEEYGYLDLLKVRACYASSKRAAETLCASYSEQYNIEVSIARPCHVYGATMLDTDRRVIGDFIRRISKKENIVLKSPGLQKRSYCYVPDAITAMISILLYGKRSEAYNIANRDANITIYQLAKLCADIAGTQVTYEDAGQSDIKQASNIMHAVLDPSKIEALGWRPLYGVREGIERTVRILSGQ